MACRSIMTPDPLTLTADDTVGSAAEQLLSHRYIILPVVAAGSRYVGLFGVFELLGLLLPKAATLDELVPDLAFLPDDLGALRSRLGELAHEPVRPHVRTDLPVLRPETPIVEALLLFYRQRSTLPVVEEDDGRLVGVLSYWDAVAALVGTTQRSA